MKNITVSALTDWLAELLIAENPFVSPCLPSGPYRGPYRIRWTRTNGESGLGMVSYQSMVDVDEDAGACRRYCREGYTYDVVADPGGATIFV
jgi:hypothetical protein